MTTFTDEDNKEAMLKAFELFGLCMAAGPCNNCVFFDRSLPEDPCYIGYPNSWPLFDISTEKGTKNRKVVLDILRRKEKRGWVNHYVTIAYITALIVRITFVLTIKVFGVMLNTEEL